MSSFSSALRSSTLVLLAPLAFSAACSQAASPQGGSGGMGPASGGASDSSSGGMTGSDGGGDGVSTGGQASGGAPGGGNSGGSDAGGTSGDGGSNSGGSDTGGPTGSGIGCEDADLFCEDFESVAAGTIPSGGGYIARDASCGAQNFDMEVSGDNPRLTSTQALKVTDHAYASCRLATSFTESDDFWLRAFIYWEEGVDFTNKEILAIELLPASGVNKDDPSMRFGNRSKEPCTTTPGPQVTMIGLGNGEVTGCDGALPTPKGEWFCFEAHVQQSGNLLANTYINGVANQYESVGKPKVDTIDLGGPVTEKINHVRMGMFTHDSTGKGNVYIDDVGISTTRLGCGN